MLYSLARRESVPWLSHSSLLSGCFAFLSCQGLIVMLEVAGLMGTAATILLIVALAPAPAAISLGIFARRAEPHARWEASLGILFGVIALMLMSCFLMMTFMMGMTM